MTLIDGNRYEVCAPVLIGTYTRISHLKKTIEALSKNDLAHITDLYIASDGGISFDDKDVVHRIRCYVNQISGFKSITLISRDVNYGSARNYAEAVELVFKKHDRIIIMEDDIVTGQNYLRYMNDGLNFYGVGTNIFAVCGYMWEKIAPLENSDVMILSMYNGWGSGFHRANYQKITSGKFVSIDAIKNFKFFIKANLAFPGIGSMIYETAYGRLSAWDMDCFLYVIKNGYKVLFPKKSLVRNIGFDGSGLRCDVNPSFFAQELYSGKRLIVKELTSVEQRLCQWKAFIGFGGVLILLKGIIFFGIKRFFGPEAIVNMVSLKKYIIKSVRLIVLK